MTSTENSLDSTGSPTPPLIDILWQWLLVAPWRVAIVAGIPCTFLILVSLAIACCMTKKSKRGYNSAPSKETAVDEEDSMDLASVVNGALEMVTIDPSESVTVDTTIKGEAAHQAMGDILNPQSFLGEQDESSVDPLVSPTGSLTDEDHADTESSLPKPRSFKQRRTSSTSSQQKALAYVEVELNPVKEENKGVIISTEQPTQYVEIAGVYKPFSPK